MNTMFWVWMAVIIITAIIEIITTDLVSIWFTFGAIIPFILATLDVLSPIWQIVIFVVASAILIASLRKITMKFLFRNGTVKTNSDALIGQKFRMIEKTDFETVGKIKIKDIEWSAVGDNQQTIDKNSVVEVVKISGNKLIVKEVKEEQSEDKEASNKATKSSKNNK